MINIESWQEKRPNIGILRSRLKKKDIDQTDLHHLIPQNSLSETCNIGELFSENNLPEHGLELFDENLGF